MLVSRGLSLAAAVGARTLVAAATGACLPGHASILLRYSSSGQRAQTLYRIPADRGAMNMTARSDVERAIARLAAIKRGSAALNNCQGQA